MNLKDMKVGQVVVSKDMADVQQERMEALDGEEVQALIVTVKADPKNRIQYRVALSFPLADVPSLTVSLNADMLPENPLLLKQGQKVLATLKYETERTNDPYLTVTSIRLED